MGIEIAGRIHKIEDEKQITERFKKREFVLILDENSEYPQHVLFQLTGNRCEKLSGFNVGDEVRVDFSLRGREWTSPKDGVVKYFKSQWPIYLQPETASSLIAIFQLRICHEN